MVSFFDKILHAWPEITSAAILSWIGNGLWGGLKYWLSGRKEKRHAQLSRFDTISEDVKKASKKYWRSNIPEGGDEELESDLRIALYELNKCVTEEAPLQIEGQKQDIEILCAELNKTLTDAELFATGVAHGPKLDIHEQGYKILIEIRNKIRESW